MLVGSHVSIRGGYLGAAKTALSIGADCFQYFPKNPRGLSIKSFDSRDALACGEFCRMNGLLSIAHAPYTTNIAVSDKPLRAQIARSLLNDLEIAEACGSVGVVVHFGKYKGNALLQGYQNSIQLMNDVLDEWHGNAMLLIENQAGEGTPMGTTLEELVQIRKLAAHPGKIGFCLDTCHAFASALWNGHNWRELQRKGEELGYFTQLRAVHLNDSMYPSGSRRDRHANIGQGEIRTEYWREFLQSSFVNHVPLILETPSSEDGTHREEIRYVRQLGLAR